MGACCSEHSIKASHGVIEVETHFKHSTTLAPAKASSIEPYVGPPPVLPLGPRSSLMATTREKDFAVMEKNLKMQRISDGNEFEKILDHNNLDEAFDVGKIE